MSDQIVKRLREAGDRLPLIGDTGTNLHLDAAKEIERLQAEITERDRRAHIISPQVFEDALKERDQLRAQLKKLNAAATAVIDSRAALGLDSSRYSVDMNLLIQLSHSRPAQQAQEVQS